MTTTRQTLEQKRAAAAWKDIQAIEDFKDPELQKKYGTLARKLAAMIQINGLGTSLAFLKAKGKEKPDKSKKPDDGHTLIFKHISAWVLSENGVNEAKTYSDLMDLVRNASMDVYRRATAEAIEYSIWLKRYVEAKDWGSAGGDSE